MKKTGKKILFIVEGENDEPDFFDQVRVVFFHNYNINYYTYKTSIHDLIDSIFDGDEIDEDIDIKKLLKANEKDPEMKKRLGEKYTDIYMVFDMEPHYHKDNSGIVEKMLCHFFNTILSLCAHHLQKANYIMSSSYTLPSAREYVQLDYSALYSKQCSMWKNEEQVYVLNTSIFWLLEYEPMRYLDMLNKHRTIFAI